MSLPRTPSFQHKHLNLINNLSSLIRPSQCPKDMMCSHSGDVDVSLRFHQPFHRIDTVICLYSNGRNPIEISGYTFKLLAVDPFPEQDIITPQEDFRIEMMVLKN